MEVAGGEIWTDAGYSSTCHCSAPWSWGCLLHEGMHCHANVCISLSPLFLTHTFLYMACFCWWISTALYTQKLNHNMLISFGSCAVWYAIFSRLPHITPWNSHTNVCNVTDTLSYTSNGIMRLHDIPLVTGMLWAGLYWTSFITSVSQVHNSTKYKTNLIKRRV